MSDSANYQYRQECTRTARAEHQAASYKLELCQVRERLAELKSQHDPLHSMVLKVLHTQSRDDVYAAAFYVVVGRVKEDK